MKKASLAMFIALVMGVTTFGVIETAYAKERPTAGSGSGTTRTTKKHHRGKHHRKNKAETPRGFVMANQL